MPKDSKLQFGHREIHGWISQRSGLVWVEDFCGLAQRDHDGQITAAVGYDHHQDKSCMFHIAAQKPFTRELLWRAFQVPFEQWKYETLVGIVQYGNGKSLHIAARLGFQLFATLPSAHPSGSLEFFKMDRAECPWLEITRKNNERRRKRTYSARSLETDGSGQRHFQYGD